MVLVSHRRHEALLAQAVVACSLFVLMFQAGAFPQKLRSSWHSEKRNRNGQHYSIRAIGLRDNLEILPNRSSLAPMQRGCTPIRGGIMKTLRFLAASTARVKRRRSVLHFVYSFFQ